jgi:hypothetical protein
MKGNVLVKEEVIQQPQQNCFALGACTLCACKAFDGKAGSAEICVCGHNESQHL